MFVDGPASLGGAQSEFEVVQHRNNAFRALEGVGNRHGGRVHGSLLIGNRHGGRNRDGLIIGNGHGGRIRDGHLMESPKFIIRGTRGRHCHWLNPKPVRTMNIGALPRQCRPQVTRIGMHVTLHSRSAIPWRLTRDFISVVSRTELTARGGSLPSDCETAHLRRE